MFNKEYRDEAIGRLESVQLMYKETADVMQDEAVKLFIHRKKSLNILKESEVLINSIANKPKSFNKELEEIRVSVREFDYAIGLESDAEQFTKVAGVSAVGATAVGAGVAAFGPTAAMAVATTFGTASTGAAISGLYGAAATNAALAWLGGGALAAGGGGMALGNAFLAMAGPIGWTIGGASLVVGAFGISNKNKSVANEAYDRAYTLKESIEKMNLGVHNINRLSSATHKLNNGTYLSFRKTKRIDNINYLEFNEDQKLELGVLVNSMLSLAKLINTRIDGENMEEIEYVKVV